MGLEVIGTLFGGGCGSLSWYFPRFCGLSNLRPHKIMVLLFQSVGGGIILPILLVSIGL